MTETIEKPSTLRIGAETLRKIATRETDPKMAAEVIRVAEKMDQHAAEFERLFVNQQPSRP
jgi:TorA maturation chaperone TorD